MSASDQLLEFWKYQGISLSPGVSDQQIQGFENHYGVCLPGDFRTYLQTVNGMERTRMTQCDDATNIFWRLPTLDDEFEIEHEEFIGPLSKLWNEPGPHAGSTRNLFIFADYCINSAVFAIHLLPGHPNYGKVFRIHALPPELAADSFSAFIEIYLRDRMEAIFGHP